MNLQNEYTKELWVLYAQANGDAYQNGKNVAQAIRAAKLQLIAEFVEALAQLQTEAASELHESWYEDELKAEADAKIYGFIKVLEADPKATVEVSEACYDHWLSELPPLKMDSRSFYFGEPLDHDKQGQPVTYFFYNDFQTGKYFVEVRSLPRTVRPASK